MNHSEISIVFAAAEHIPQLLKLSPKLPKLKIIVAMDEVEHDTRRVLDSWAEARNIRHIDISERTFVLHG